MRIYDITIKNFRGIAELSKLKVGEINSFVGKNDSGKSNILKALNTFFNDKFDNNDIFKGINDGEKTEISLRFTPSEEVNSLALDADGKIHLKKTFEFSSAGRVVKTFNYICNDINSDKYSNCWGIKESDINSYCTALEIDYSRSGRGVTNASKITLIDENTIALGRIQKEHEATEFLKNIKKQYSFVELPEYSLFDAEQDLNISSTSFQSQFKPIATESLNRNFALTDQIETNVQTDLETEFAAITTLMQKNVPELEKIKTSPSCNWGNLVKFDLSLKFRNDNYDIPISNKGTGFKRLLMVAYFEYLAQKTTKQYQIFGIEEPETFLHPELQQDLLDSIVELSDNSQFFLTTHSPVFAGSTKDSNIIVVKKENEVSTYYNYENEDEILNVVIQELGIKPNYNLLNDNYRKAIFVEGSGDVNFWQIAFEKINGVLPDDILFVPCGGDQIDFFVNAHLCRKINRKFIVVVDSDKGAIDYNNKLANKAQLIENVENLGGKAFILHKREIENYYSKEAIQRLLGANFPLPVEFQIEDFKDIKEEIKTHILAVYPNNFKAKNNFDIFKEMTKDEWLASGVTVGDSTDLEIIINKILEK
ncbi:putative ATP-dependent endonuclease of OLD family [Mariniflexile fucanivorans]|uniref:Putative ATP-dependent endonuclease of OLD family n=1 Tax=Mariniflexile fucanivorans TaxID=264023 RepID=A0A4R1RF30_9FLAO|nr:AAA family ATPase [Mariniflexile fucanivorans]TCL64554.1 putative ATP-dependent endonuclease of OLD family [Mariniflexile fucanivorans]